MEVDQPGCIPLDPGQATAVVCRVLELEQLPGWSPGPVPFCQPSSPETRARGLHLSTDATARSTLVSRDLAPVLYDPKLRRWLEVRDPVAGIHLNAVEVLAIGDGATTLLAVHLADAARLPSIRRPTSPEAVAFWTALKDQHLPAARYAEGPVRSVSFASAPSDQAMVEAYTAISGIREGSGQRSARHELTVSKPDWSALILRDGLAVISHPAEDTAFAPHLQVQTHSVYLDALLLAWSQRILLDRSGERAVHARLDVPDELVALERGHFEFKRTAWRRSLTHKRTSPLDDVLTSLQRELLTDRDVEDVEDRVRDGARLARTLHQEESTRAQEALNRTVQIAAIVIGALGLAYAAAPTVAQPSWALFLWASLAGLAAIGVSLIALSLMSGKD